jgi:predicted Zn-dependent peptidase
MIDRIQQPEISHAYNFDLIEPEKQSLPNGVDIYYIEGGKQDVCRIDVLFKAGNIFESKNLLSSVTNDLLGEGTASKTSLQVNEAFDFYGAYIQRESSRDYAGLSLFASDKYLANLMPFMLEVILQSTYPQHEFDIYLKNRKARFEDSLKKVEFICRNEFTGLMYGEHPYGKPLQLQHFLQINRDEIEAWYHQHYVQQIPVVFVTGKVEGDSKKIIGDAFAQLTGQTTAFPTIEFGTPRLGAHFIEQAGAIQSAIRIGRPMITIEHADYAALSVANTVLGGYFGSRLMKNIREEKGFTYGIGSGLVSFEKNGMWMIGTEVGKDVTTQALEEVYKEINILAQEPVKEDELEIVKNYILGNYIKSIDGAFNQSEKIKTTILRGLETDFYNKHMQKILATTAQDVQKMVIQYFTREHLVELVVGGK